jgi:SAM-dependent methyltransferase
MNKADWDARFRDLLERGAAHHIGGPEPIVEKFASALPPGRALDLACGAGKNALWLAQQGWDVTAVDWSASAIELVQAASEARGAKIKTHVANLEAHEFTIQPGVWDLILMCRYFQADLFEPAKLGLAPGGILIAIVLLQESQLGDSGQPQSFRVRPGELAAYADVTKGWTILHHDESWRAPGAAPGHKATATIVIRWDGGEHDIQTVIPLVPHL